MHSLPPIICLGPEGTNAHEAATRFARDRYGADRVHPTFLTSNFAALRGIETGWGVGLAIVPVENSTAGLVDDTRRFWLRALLNGVANAQPLCVVGEIHLPIRHCLATYGVSPLVTRVLSHPQALAQCAGYLADNGLVGEPATSTADAARLVCNWQNPAIAAICSAFAAKFYNLTVPPNHEGIEDQQGNETRFHIVGHEPTEPTGSDRTALMFELEDKPGAVHYATGAFAAHGINLSSQHSIGLGPGRYAHYFEVDCHQDDPSGMKALTCLRTLVVQDRLLVLGSYPRSPRPTEGGVQ